ncbi:hypothetical protein BFW01_g7144 [Lasiodiplodia theobromae]|nr:hypothetical protein BFW01_g7144 [Lasiodiplodia theobromae]
MERPQQQQRRLGERWALFVRWLVVPGAWTEINCSSSSPHSPPVQGTPQTADFDHRGKLRHGDTRIPIAPSSFAETPV